MTSHPRKIRKDIVALTLFTVLLVLPLCLWPYVSTHWFPKPLRSIKTRWGVSDVIFSPDGRNIASRTNALRIYNWRTGALLKQFPNSPASPFDPVFSPDGKTIASGNTDCAIRVRDVTTGQILHTMWGHTAVANVAYSPDGKLLASGSWSKKMTTGDINLWNASTGQLIRHFPKEKSFVADVCFTPDGKTLVTVGADGLKMWDVKTGKLICAPENDDQLLAVAASPDGRFIASGGWGKKVELRDAHTGALQRTWKLGVPKNYNDAEVRSLAFSPDSRSIAIAASRTTLTVWDVETGHLLRSFKGHDQLIFSTAFSPDGRTLASGDMAGTINLWNVE